MGNFENIVNFILNITPWSVAKVVFLFCLLIYLVFTTIVIRQVSSMTEFIISPLNFWIKAFSWLLFLLTVAVFLGSLIFL